MNCPHCEYLLFNLTQPICPECGREFDVEQYQFAPSAVTFHCPHCDQAYYGNDAQGLPSPRAFTCAQCQREVTLRELRVVPSTPEVRGSRVDVSPWDERERTGRVTGWWRMTGMVLSRPSEAFRRSYATTIRSAWGFAAISMYVGILPAMLIGLIFLFGVVLMPGGGPFGAGPGGGPGLWMVLGALGMVPFLAILPLILAALVTGAVHLALLALGPARRPMGDTFRTILLAMAPYCFYWIPCVGSSLAGVWFLVAAIMGVREIHGIGGWRAALAVLWLPAAYLALVVTGFAIGL